MSEFKRTSHAVYDIKYHLVWIPKYRRKTLTHEIRIRLRGIFYQIAEEYEFQIEEQQVKEDHVHLFVSAPPRYSPAKLVNIIKSISARQIFKEFPGLRRRCWNKKLWADGYFVRAVGDKVTAEVIERYIRNQKEQVEQLELFEEELSGKI